jgi:hypothetical protein
MMHGWTGALVGLAAAIGVTGAGARAASVSPYDHIFVIMEENHEYSQIIGSKNAPNINGWANTYGLATSYDAVTHPSEPNYVALMGGSYFGIQDDNAWTTHKINAPDLTSQLEGAGKTWKGYFQNMPTAGFTGTCAPSNNFCYYASKHNGAINYDVVNGSPSELARETPIAQLTTDLAGTLPNFAVIVPDQCHDMHGGVGTCAATSNAKLVSAGDKYAAGLVGQITGASFWGQGNNAVVIVFDEGSTNVGGGGHVAAVVITSKGPRALKDGGAYTHYSLLGTIEAAFGVGCLLNTCTANLMAPLFAHP